MRAEFPAKVKAAAFDRANGHCEACGAKLFPGNVEYDHVLPDGLGGTPTLDNCQCLCRTCHKAKTHQSDRPKMTKADRSRKKLYGIKRPKRPMPGSKASGWRKRMDGTTERRT